MWREFKRRLEFRDRLMEQLFSKAEHKKFRFSLVALSAIAFFCSFSIIVLYELNVL